MQFPMRDEILQLFGERLRQIRTERNLSQERLAELAGLDRNYIGQIERAERNVALVNIIRIAKALEIEPQLLFTAFTAAKVGELR
jgi:transcriptional regulator with XRE-family HTH domain